jgi:mannose-6-phosphate isomerase-like protein (cupin superfamily)
MGDGGLQRRLQPGRTWGPLRAVGAAMHTGLIIRRASDAPWTAGLRGFFDYSDLGAAAASNGAVGAHLIRARKGEASPGAWHTHDLRFQLVLVLSGWVRFEYEGYGEVLLTAGDSVCQPPGVRHREIAHSDDLEMLEVTLPAAFKTHDA